MSLRVAVVLDSVRQPAWICRVVDHVRAKHQLVRVTISPSARTMKMPPLARLYQRIDDKLFAAADDALAPCEIAPLAAGAAADVTLAFAPATADGEVWTVSHAGLAEFARRAPLLRAELHAGDTLVDSVTSAPYPISYRRSMSRLALRTASMLEHALDRRAREVNAPRRTVTPAPPRNVTSSQIASAAAGAAMEWVKAKWAYRFTREHWRLAFSFDGERPFEPRRFHPIIPPRDRFWADPFVVAEGDRAWIFVEELIYPEKRGFISVLEARRDGTWSQPRAILHRPYHLSYPCVFRWNGDFYMVPESQANETVELFRCTEFPYRWEPDTVLLAGIRAVDATLFEADGRWWMYAATPSGDGAGFDRLRLYHAATPRGPWTPHAWDPLECDVAGGRPAGRPFVRDGKLLRATQVGTPWYGHSMQIREIVTLTPEAWEERVVTTIAPDWSARIDGTHTLNVDGEVTVVDALRMTLGRRPRSRPPRTDGSGR